MSRIYFADSIGEAELRGSERAYMGITIDDIWAALIVPHWDTSENPHALRRIVPSAPAVDRALGRARQYGDFDDPSFWKPHSMRGAQFVLPDGPQVSFFEAALNTAMLFGPVMTVFAMLHGGCEIHAYVEGPDRAWLADIIDQGRATDMMRPDMGWEDVRTLLRARDDQPVVTSFSVTESFPGMHAAGWKWDERNETRWRNLTDEQRWEKSIDGLRKPGVDWGVKMGPESSWFGIGTTKPWHAFNLTALARSLGPA